MRRTDSQGVVWKRAPHTGAKHDILVKYLQAWFAIFGGTAWVNKVGFLDGFAGPGVYSGGEPGSPVHALTALLDHEHFPKWGSTEFVFLFNEYDRERFESLSGVVDSLMKSRKPWPSNVKASAHNRVFSELAEEMLDSAEKKGRGLIPIFAFVDPFGYRDAPMALIKRLLAYDKAELFIYFDFNSANRFAGKNPAVEKRFEALFGCDDFKKAPPSGPTRGKFLHDLYERQLKSECSFAHVRSFAMINKSGHTSNYLFFGTRNLQAFDRMKQAMWKMAPSGDYQFADNLAGQQVLFTPQVDTTPLKRELITVFSGKTVTIEEVVNYVIANTPFHSSHVKVKTLKPMQVEGRISSPNQRKAGTYPPGTILTFHPPR